MIRALVSIGTNSTRLYILNNDQRVAAESRGTRIGTGIGTTGSIDPAAAARTLAAVDEYIEVAQNTHVETIDAIATSALRRASDGNAFIGEVERRVGVAPRILTGDEEARYSFLGATAHHNGAHEIGVLDVGGGSTELAVDSPRHARDAGIVRRTISLEVGAVRLAERHREILGARALADTERNGVEAAARDDARAILQPLTEMRGFEELIVVGGTAFTAAAMIAGGVREETHMTRVDVETMIGALLERELDARKRMPNIRPQRADILPAGLIVIDTACELLGISAFTVSEADLLLGYLTSDAFRAVPFPKQ